MFFSFTDVAYKKFSLLVGLRFLDLCGAQVLSNNCKWFNVNVLHFL